MMVAVAPGVTPVATPAAVMVAPVDALQVTLLVMFCMDPSAKVPVAVNCCVPLGATLAEAGVTAMDRNGLATVRVVVPLTAPEVAVIVVLPTAMAIAAPETLMVATAVLDDSQFAVAVRFFVVPSLYIPVAVNCWVVPKPMDGLEGVAVIEVSVT